MTENTLVIGMYADEISQKIFQDSLWLLLGFLPLCHFSCCCVGFPGKSIPRWHLACRIVRSAFGSALWEEGENAGLGRGRGHSAMQFQWQPLLTPLGSPKLSGPWELSWVGPKWVARTLYFCSPVTVCGLSQEGVQSLVRWPSATNTIPEGAAFPADGATSPLLKGNLTEHLSAQYTCLFFFLTNI